MKRCFYCGTKKEVFVTFEKPKCESLRKYKYCDEECVGKTNDFKGLIDRTKSLFWMGIGTAVFLCVLGIVLSSFFLIPAMALMTLAFFILGLTIVLLPVPTPEFLAMLGIKKMLIVIRVIGVLLMVFSPLWVILLHINTSGAWTRVGEQIQNLF